MSSKFEKYIEEIEYGDRTAYTTPVVTDEVYVTAGGEFIKASALRRVFTCPDAREAQLEAQRHVRHLVKTGKLPA